MDRGFKTDGISLIAFVTGVVGRFNHIRDQDREDIIQDSLAKLLQEMERILAAQPSPELFGRQLVWNHVVDWLRADRERRKHEISFTDVGLNPDLLPELAEE